MFDVKSELATLGGERTDKVNIKLLEFQMKQHKIMTSF